MRELGLGFGVLWNIPPASLRNCVKNIFFCEKIIENFFLFKFYCFIFFHVEKSLFIVWMI